MRKLFTLLMVSFALSSAAVAKDALSVLKPLELQGQYQFKRFMLRVYKAQLYVSQKPWSYDQDFALSILYQMNIDAPLLVSTSVREIERNKSRDKATLARTSKVLASIFENVKKGERITAFYDKKGQVDFWKDTRYLGRIEEKEMAQDFLDIWLGSVVRYAKMRCKLKAEEPC